MTTSPQISRVLTFWFGPPTSPHPFSRWFRPDPALDSQIASSFSPLVLSARNQPSELDSWTSTPTGTLALLILLDQFPRNIYRGTPSAFASDRKALNVALDAIARGFDLRVPLMQQGFFYLPMMHSESLVAQVASMGCYEGLVRRAEGKGEEGTEAGEFARASLGSAREHMEVVRRFGRFPSRNGILGREGTGEEGAWLEERPGGL